MDKDFITSLTTYEKSLRRSKFYRGFYVKVDHLPDKTRESGLVFQGK